MQFDTNNSKQTKSIAGRTPCIESGLSLSRAVFMQNKRQILTDFLAKRKVFLSARTLAQRISNDPSRVIKSDKEEELKITTKTEGPQNKNILLHFSPVSVCWCPFDYDRLFFLFERETVYRVADTLYGSKTGFKQLY